MTDVDTRLESWAYERALNDLLPPLIAASPIRALAMFAGLLSTATRSALSDYPSISPPEDLSRMWLEYADDKIQPNEYDVRRMLVGAVVQAAKAALLAGHAEEAWRELGKQSDLVFSRIRMRVAAEAGAPSEWAEDLLLSNELLARWDPEYGLLAASRFGSLTPEAREEWFGLVRNGPSEKWLGSRLEKVVPPTEMEAARLQLSLQWQRARFEALGDSFPPEWDELRATLGLEPTNPEIPTQTHVFGGSPASPLTPDQVVATNLPDLAEFLRSWEPRPDPWESPSALASSIRIAAAASPAHFNGVEAELKGLAPIYVEAMLNGLAEAANNQLDSWDILVELSDAVIALQEVPKLRGDRFDHSIDWRGARRSICWLLEKGLESDQIAHEFGDRIWRITQVLLLDDEPEDSYLDAAPLQNAWQGDTFSFLAVNTVRGAALTLALSFGAWVKRSLGDAASSLDDIPGLRAELERHLDPAQDPSPTIRSVFGQYLYRLWFLDEQWTKGNFERIFPSTGAEVWLGDVAWSTYVGYNSPHIEVVALGKAQYERALDQVSERQEAVATEKERRLVQHVMELQLLTDDARDLRVRLFAGSRPELKAYALEFVGIVMKQERLPDDNSLRSRLMNLWDEVAEGAQTEEPPLDQLAAFGTWFAASYFEETWAIERLKVVLERGAVFPRPYEVVERLARVTDDHLLVAVGCLERIIEPDRDRWSVFSWRDQGHELLARGIRSPDADVREAARTLVSRLVLMGHEVPFADLAP